MSSYAALIWLMFPCGAIVYRCCMLASRWCLFVVVCRCCMSSCVCSCCLAGSVWLSSSISGVSSAMSAVFPWCSCSIAWLVSS